MFKSAEGLIITVYGETATIEDPADWGTGMDPDIVSMNKLYEMMGEGILKEAVDAYRTNTGHTFDKVYEGSMPVVTEEMDKDWANVTSLSEFKTNRETRVLGYIETAEEIADGLEEAGEVITDAVTELKSGLDKIKNEFAEL